MLLAVYAIAATYLWARQAYYIFRPERIIASTPADYQLPFEDVYVSINDGNSNSERIHAWWIPAEYPGSIFIYGHSLGGAVAIELAMRKPEAAGLIIEAAFTSIADMAREIPKYRFFPLDLIVHQRFDSISKVGLLQVPILYLHGTDDRLVPPEMSRELFRHTASAKQLKFITGGGHNNSAAVGGDEYLQAVKNFIDFARKVI